MRVTLSRDSQEEGVREQVKQPRRRQRLPARTGTTPAPPPARVRLQDSSSDEARTVGGSSSDVARTAGDSRVPGGLVTQPASAAGGQGAGELYEWEYYYDYEYQ